MNEINISISYPSKGIVTDGSAVCFIIPVSRNHCPHQNVITGHWGEYWKRVAKGMPSQIWLCSVLKRKLKLNSTYFRFWASFCIHALLWQLIPRRGSGAPAEFTTPRAQLFFQVPIFLHYFKVFGTTLFKTARTENQSEDFCNRLQPTLNHWSRRWRLWPFGTALQGTLAAQSSGSCAERQGLTLALRCDCACSCRLNF